MGIFTKKQDPKPPEPPRWTVHHGMEAVGRNPAYPSLDKRLRLVVDVRNSDYDPRYPTSSESHREIIGDADPTDREAISELLAKGAVRCVELSEGEAYADAAFAALGSLA